MPGAWDIWAASVGEELELELELGLALQLAWELICPAAPPAAGAGLLGFGGPQGPTAGPGWVVWVAALRVSRWRVRSGPGEARALGEPFGAAEYDRGKLPMSIFAACPKKILAVLARLFCSNKRRRPWLLQTTGQRCQWPAQVAVGASLRSRCAQFTGLNPLLRPRIKCLAHAEIAPFLAGPDAHAAAGPRAGAAGHWPHRPAAR
jgi:hypothetical protein